MTGVSADAVLATRLLQQLVGGSLDQLCVGDGEVQLQLSTGHSVQFESPIVVAGAAAVPAHGLDGLALLVPLLNEEVADVVADDAGGLVLTLGTTTLRCPATPESEAWNVSGPRGVLVVSTPGGGLATWAD